MLREKGDFRKSVINIFTEGVTGPFLAQTLPPFEASKLCIGKLSFDEDAMIDTLVRYKEKGAYSASHKNNAEIAIGAAIEAAGLPYETGDLAKLIEQSAGAKRRMDFIILGKDNPKIVIESSHLVTTSSGQGDKEKT